MSSDSWQPGATAQFWIKTMLNEARMVKKLGSTSKQPHIINIRCPQSSVSADLAIPGASYPVGWISGHFARRDFTMSQRQVPAAPTGRRGPPGRAGNPRDTEGRLSSKKATWAHTADPWASRTSPDRNPAMESKEDKRQGDPPRRGRSRPRLPPTFRPPESARVRGAGVGDGWLTTASRRRTSLPVPR